MNLSSDNVMLNQREELVIIGLSAARSLEISNHAEADIFAAGVILFEMATGIPPFETDEMKELLQKEPEKYR